MKSYPKEFFNRRFSQDLFITKKGYKKRYLSIFKRMGLKEGDIVLDIGCGQGGFLAICRENNVRAFGLDYSIEGLRVAKRFGMGNVVVGDANCLPIRSKWFKNINASQILELLEDKDLAIEEAKRVSKGGNFYFEMRNKDFLIFTILRKLSLYKVFFKYEDLGYEEIKDLFNRHQLKIERIFKSDVFLYWENLFSFMKVVILKILRPVIPTRYFFGISFICK